MQNCYENYIKRTKMFDNKCSSKVVYNKKPFKIILFTTIRNIKILQIVKKLFNNLFNEWNNF